MFGHELLAVWAAMSAGVCGPPRWERTCFRVGRSGLEILRKWSSQLLLGLVAVLVCQAELVSGAETAPPSAGGESIDFRRQRVVNQTLLRDPQAELLLQRFADALQDEDDVLAVRVFQQIRELQYDSFYWDADQIVSVRRTAERLFLSRPQLRSTYEALYAAQAAGLWDPSDPTRWPEIVRRFRYTPTGRAALLRLADQAWDQGELVAAQRVWDELTSNAVDRDALSPRRQAQQKLLFQDGNGGDPSGRGRSARASTGTAQDAEVTAGLAVILDQRAEQYRRTWSRPEQRFAEGMERHCTPPLRTANWSVPRLLFSETPAALGIEDAEQIRGALQQWSIQQHEQLTPELTTLAAVAVNDLLVFRDLDAVCAVPVPKPGTAAGTRMSLPARWRFLSPLPLWTSLQTEQDPYSGVTTNHPAVQRLWLANSIAGHLTTDGMHLFLVDQFARTAVTSIVQTAALTETTSSTPEEAPVAVTHRLTNRLVALPVQPESGNRSAVADTGSTAAISPEWTISPAGWCCPEVAQNVADHPLAGHFFLGPPAVSGGTAFVLSEAHQRIVLSALDPATGALRWMQPVSNADRDLTHDLARAIRACVPVISDGVVVCDNGNGQLIGVDASLGTLLWNHCYVAEDARQDSGRWTYTQTTRVSQPGALNPPLVMAGRVLLLPDRAYHIHCCDLRTGELLWKIRRNDAEYLAGVWPPRESNLSPTQPILLAVGTRDCRALDLETATEIWQTPVGVVTGRGVQVGGQFLIPVADRAAICRAGADEPLTTSTNDSTVPTRSLSRGRIVCLDLTSGTQFGFDAWSGSTAAQASEPGPGEQPGETSEPEYAFSLGNLLMCQDHVVAVGMNQILGFEQAGAVATQLQQVAAERQLGEIELQRCAEAELTLGQIESAKTLLRQGLQQPATRLAVRQRTRTMYRELLYQELHRRPATATPENRLTILRELGDLAESPAQQARYLLAELVLLRRQADRDKVWDAAQRFARLGKDVALPAELSAGHRVTSASWLPGLYAEVLNQCTPAEKLTRLDELEQHYLQAISSRSNSELQTVVQMLQAAPRAGTPAGNASVRTASEAKTAESIAFDWLPPAERRLIAIRAAIQLELISRDFADGNLQAAELRMLQLQRTPVLVGQRLACQGLVKLYARLGFHHEAGRMLELLTALNQQTAGENSGEELLPLLRYVNASVGEQTRTPRIGWGLPGNEQTWVPGQDFIVHFDRQNLSWQAFQNRAGLAEPVRLVQIREQTAAALPSEDPYSRRRPLYHLPDQSWTVLQQLETHRKRQPTANETASHPFDRGGLAERIDEQHLVLLDPRTAGVTSRIGLPGTRIGVGSAPQKNVGHLMPICVEGDVIGVSLLQGRPVWRRSEMDFDHLAPPPLERFRQDPDGVLRARQPTPRNRPRSLRTELGPMGPGYCLVQTARALTCLDPATGNVRWQRLDLDPQGGLWADRSAGVLGDGHVAVYFSPNQNDYSVLCMATGRLLKRGQLAAAPLHIHRTRQVFGRQLLFVTSHPTDEQSRKLCIWDPLEDELLLEQPFGPRDLYQTDGQDLTLLLDRERLVIYRPAENRRIVELNLPAEWLGAANYLRVMRHEQRYLVNLYQTQRSSDGHGYTSRFTDAPWQMTHINGPLICINAASGQLEWCRRFSNRSLISDDGDSLPFLVLCAQSQTRPGNEPRTLLLEIIDWTSGNTLARRDDLTTGRLLTLNHERGRREVRLSGLDREFVIHYGGPSVTQQRPFLDLPRGLADREPRP